MTVLQHASRRTFVSLRRHRNYRLYFSGQLASVCGTWMQNIALYWLAVQLAPPSARGLAVGLVSICRFGPFTVLGLLAGVVTDRFDNRRTVMVTQAVQMALSAVLAAITLLGTVRLWELYAIAALTGAALVFDSPARQNLTFRMVGRDELPNAIALNSSLVNTARIVGPAVAGVVIASLGAGWAFTINAVSFLAVLSALLAMRTDEFFPFENRTRPTVWRGTREGFGYARRSTTVRVVLVMMVVFASICFNFNIFLPLLAKQTLDAGPRSLGVLSASFGVGALIGALVSAALARARWRVLLTGAAGFGLAELLIAPTRSLELASVLLFLAGLFFATYTATANAKIQLVTPDHLRGRVLGLYFYAWNGLSPFGALFVGWLCDRGGTELGFTVAGCSALAATAGGYFVLRRRTQRPQMRPRLAA
ncbi:MAG TPA: MFS transporter [Gaiellaceae bacterium]|nr:MFS transporter [Gaiellaceae bacterium]